MELQLLFGAYCLMMLYICTKFCENISKGFRVTDLNIRVNARVVANVDAHMDTQKNGSLYRSMPKAGMTKRGLLLKEFALMGTNSFLYEMTPISKEGNNETDLSCFP